MNRDRRICPPRPSRLLASVAKTGAYRPLIDGTFPFDRIADAHARVDTQRKRGNVIVTLAVA